MRRWLFVAVGLVIVLGVAAFGYYHWEEARTAERQQQFIRELHESQLAVRSEEPGGGLARSWCDCLTLLQRSDAREGPNRYICRSYVAQGVRSTLVALRFDNEFVPVIESRLAGAEDDGPLIVDIVGGPGDHPFFSDPAITDEIVRRAKDGELLPLTHGLMEERAQYQLLQRGFTIASIGYWGTQLRTLDEPDEMDIALGEVRLVIDHFREQLGQEPPLLLSSLGNHLALGALGEQRLEAAPFVSVVPLMTGLQDHLAAANERRERSLREAEEGDIVGEWSWFNIYSRSDQGFAFEVRRMRDMNELVPQYIGSNDFAWTDVQPASECSRIVLGDRDPRTTDYLASNTDLPPFVTVLRSGHDVYQLRTYEMEQIFNEFADCIASLE